MCKIIRFSGKYVTSSESNEHLITLNADCITTMSREKNKNGHEVTRINALENIAIHTYESIEMLMNRIKQSKT